MRHVLKTLLFFCAGTSLALAQGSPDGEKWKVTSTMQMSGMSMPGSTAEICKQPGEDNVPVKADDNCRIYDVKRTGNVQSFKMKCTGEEAMEGSAQFTYLGPDHYQGKMTVNMQGETMTMNYEGRKLGRCDGGEANLVMEKLMADADKQAAASQAAMAEQCRQFAAEATSPQIMKGYCKDPADHRTFCAAVQTPDKFQQLADLEKHAVEMGQPDRVLAESASLCGFEVAAVRTRLCNTAEQQEDLKFIASQCPAQGAALAQRHCAGRSYTSMSPKHRDFCASYAAANPQEQTPAGKAKGIFNMGKKALGGILGN